MKPSFCFVLSGSGSQLVAEAGAMKAMLERVEMAAIGGTSGGALVGAALAHGMSAAAVREICRQTFKSPILERLRFWHWSMRRWGLYSAKPLQRVLDAYLPKTIGELGVPFGAVICPAAARYGVVVRNDRDPKAKCREVVAASAAIPIFFEPVVVQGYGRCFDGGTFANICADMWDDRPEPTIVIRTSSPPDDRAPSPPESAAEYGASVVSTLLSATNATHVSRKHWVRTLTLSPPGSSMKMVLSSHEVRERFEYGYRVASVWMDRQLATYTNHVGGHRV